MNHHQHFSATSQEPAPLLRFGGVNDDIPVLTFGDQFAGTDIHLTAIPDLPTWLREFASHLTEFAELVEVRAMGAAS